MKRSKEEVIHIILGKLNDFENIAITNPYYNKFNYIEDKEQLINELELKYNCVIDRLFYNIYFKY